ncbi:HPr kinase/phosphorylase [Mangrovicella endophytica]|uniref:HPr kinase/phosphorylase n=1 Tax=Mangrovicella endophytica TaxID=2066697 RepID=UPI000C9E474B|nr:hypothetical protein [Mangrovicella endophytica]
MTPNSVNLHASAIAIAGLGILIRGAARAGKSALTLSALRRAEAAGLHAGLVADDRVIAALDDGAVRLSAPPSIAGLIEISGAGIWREPATIETAELRLIVDLSPPDAVERLPEKSSETLLGVSIRRIALPQREAAFGADVLVSLCRNGRQQLDRGWSEGACAMQQE